MNEYSVLEKIHFANELWVFIIPTVLMAVDIITGSTYAWVKHDFKSFKMRQGLAKKCGEILILFMGELFSIGLGLPGYILKGISAYIIIMELISIFENFDKLGVPIPKFIRKALSDAHKKIEEGGEKNDPDNTNGSHGQDDGHKR